MISRAPVTAAIRDLLAAGVGRPVGVGVLPTGTDGRPAPLPYLVLYPLGGTTEGAPLTDRGEDASWEYQVTIVAGRTDQAEWAADRTRAAVLDRDAAGRWAYPLTPAGARVWAREPVAEDLGDADTGLVTLVHRYRFKVTAG
ncbi:hypothetical protein ACN20G_33440 (plasmid) [Streptomyces sp. BI20]|uniref:hypothetical protein n=1 Tax=Streptomyces sp. BI20 TaxID=3403460 RepID=UPI003C765CED